MKLKENHKIYEKYDTFSFCKSSSWNFIPWQSQLSIPTQWVDGTPMPKLKSI